jgi:hypothetical protein
MALVRLQRYSAANDLKGRLNCARIGTVGLCMMLYQLPRCSAWNSVSGLSCESWKTTVVVRVKVLSLCWCWNARETLGSPDRVIDILRCNPKSNNRGVTLPQHHRKFSVGRDRSVGIASRYGLDSPGIESRWGRVFQHPPRSALGPTQPPVQRVPGQYQYPSTGTLRWPPTRT